MALDERLRHELEQAGHPADPTGVYEHLIRRRERRQVIRRVKVAALAVAVVAASAVGVVALSRVFETVERTPGGDPVPTRSDEPSPSPSASKDIGVGFPVCAVTSVHGEFAPGVDGTAFVATRKGDTGGCPKGEGAFELLAVDVTGDGLADASLGPLECEMFCSAFAAPDIDADGTDELLVVNVQFTVAGLKLFEVVAEGDPAIVPVTVAPPGTDAFEPGVEPQLWLGGDEGRSDAIRCEPNRGGRAFVSTTAEVQPELDAPERYDVTETWFLLEGTELRVVDIRTYSVPFGDNAASFRDTGGCGAKLVWP